MEISSLGLLPVILVLVTIAIGAFIKGITGLGLPMFAIPALALFVPVETAVAVMALPSLAANVGLVYAHRKQSAVIRGHRAFLLVGIAGVFAGTWFLARVEDWILRTVLIAWLGIYLIQQLRNSPQASSGSLRDRLSGIFGFCAGALQGATGISAPVIAPYFHNRDLTIPQYAFSVAFAFGLFTVVQLMALSSVKIVTPELLGYSALATLTTLVFIPLGVKLSGRLSRQTFDRILLATFAGIELKLIYDTFF